MKAIIFDVETTGFLKAKLTPLDQQPEIIELGALFVEDGSVTAELTQLIKPKIEKLPTKIIEVTGITDQDLIGMPSFGEYFNQLKNFFGSGVDYLICHNASFDTGILQVELRRYSENSLRGIAQTKSFNIEWPEKTICTMLEYSSPGKKWMKLTELYEKIVGKPLDQTHRALDDCKAVHEILVKDNFYDRLTK